MLVSVDELEEAGGRPSGVAVGRVQLQLLGQEGSAACETPSHKRISINRIFSLTDPLPALPSSGQH